jgi:hypothetical protein
MARWRIRRPDRRRPGKEADVSQPSALLPLTVCLRRWLVGGVFVYVAVVALLGGRRAAVPALLALLAAWAVVPLWLWWRGPRGKATLLEIIVSNVALTLLLAELGLRLVAAQSPGALLVSATLDAHRLRPGHDYGAGLRGNSLGYPGADLDRHKPPGVFRVAALGDSFAVGPVVPFDDNYLTILERRLPGVQVCNFGVSGAGPREYHAVLQRDGWAHQPDAVLLSVFVGNDITEELPAPRRLHPRQHALVLLCERGARLWQERHARPAPAGPPDRLQPALAPATFRAVEARRLAVCLRTAPPGLETQWQRACAHLAAIVHDCRRRGVPLAVVLIPDEFQVNPAVLDQAVVDAGVTSEAVDVALPQRRLAAFFARHQVPCLDLLPHFAGAADTYAAHDTHWNGAGNRLAAERLAAWLPDRLALKVADR